MKLVSYWNKTMFINPESSGVFMKNLIQKLKLGRVVKKAAPLVLALTGIAGCATYPSVSTTYSDNVIDYEVEKPAASDSSGLSKKDLLDLRNGYFARTDKAVDGIDLAASALLGEVILQKTDKGYDKINTKRYLLSDDKDWNNMFYQACKTADANPDFILEEDEVNELLDLIYEAIFNPDKIIWVDEE
jgi:hypothetical protein